MDLDTSIDLIVKAREKEREQRIWEKYLAFKPQKDGKTYKSYEDFLKENSPSKITNSNKTKDDIIKRAESIRSKDKVS